MQGRPRSKRTYLTPREVADVFRVSPMTIRNWCVRGWLQAELTAGGHRRYPIQEVERFARERGMTFQRQAGEIEKVLIVDDDENFGKFLLAALGEHPEVIEARVARDGSEAGHLLHTFEPSTVMLDLVMPALDGFQVCQHIKHDPSTRGIRVIAMTGYADRGNERRILALGAERCITKPISLDVLLGLLGVGTQSVAG